MSKSILGAMLIGAFVTSVPIAIHADHHGDKEKRKDLKVIECPPECGFLIRSHNKDEMVEIVKDHARTHHNMEMTDDQVRAIMKSAHEVKKDKDKDKDEKKERDRRY